MTPEMKLYIGIGLLAAGTLTGVLLSRGKMPYSVGLLTGHKLLTVAGIVFLILFYGDLNFKIDLLSGATALFSVFAVISGAIISAKKRKRRNKRQVALHKISSFVALVLVLVLVYQHV